MKRLLRSQFLLPAALLAVVGGCSPERLGSLNTGADRVDLSIDMSVNTASALEGGSVTFTITVQNHGPVAADTVTAGDTLPTGLTYVTSTASTGTYSPTTGIWSIGSLAVDGLQTLTLTATVNAGTAGTTLTNRAGVLAFQTDSLLENNVDSVSVSSVSSSGATQLVYTAQPASTTAGSAFGVTVAARNGQGVTVPGFTGAIALSISGGTGTSGAHLLGTTTVAATSGVATFAGLSIDSAGTGYTLSANAAGLSAGTSGAFNVTAGNATNLQFIPQPSGSSPGAAFSVTVNARDALGNRATSFTGNVTIAIGTNPAAGTLSGTTTVAATAGVAAFNVSINNAGNGYTLTASATGLTGATSSPFNIAIFVTDEPADPGSGYFWADNFDRYASAAAMFAGGGCPGGTQAAGLPSASSTYGQRTTPNSDDGCNSTNTSGFSLVTGRIGSGKAMRSTIAADPSHNQQSIDWLSPWDPNMGNYSGAIVVQFYFRASSGGTPGTFGTKWLEMWFDNSPPSRRVQWGLDLGTNARPLWSAVLGVNPGGTVNRTPQPVGPFWDQVNDGNWHRFTGLFRANTSSSYNNTSGTSSANETYTGTSSRNGRVAAWIDGTKIMDYSQATVGVTPPGGLNPWCRQGDVDMIPAAVRGSYFMWPSVFNGSPVAWTLDHDDLKVWIIP